MVELKNLAAAAEAMLQGHPVNSVRTAAPAKPADDDHECYEGHSHYQPDAGEGRGSLLQNLMQELLGADGNAAKKEAAPPEAQQAETEKKEPEKVPEPPPAAKKTSAAASAVVMGAPVTRADLRRSVIMSEILGKPLALRRKG